jgi:hypothetical protein
VPFPHPALTVDADEQLLQPEEAPAVESLGGSPDGTGLPGPEALAPAPASRRSGAAWAAGSTAPSGAPAGEAAPEAAPKAAEAEGESASADDELAAKMGSMDDRWWAGKPVMQPAQVEKEQAAGKLPQGPYLSGKDFNNLTDSQLYQIFTKGVADVPSAHPDETGGAPLLRERGAEM